MYSAFFVVIRFFLRFISDSFSSFMGMVWRLELRKSHRLSVLPGKLFRFGHYGDITRLLYEQQHLVRFGKSFESDILNRYVHLIVPGAVVVDIGANIGLYSLLGGKTVGKNGKIIAFEPQPKTYRTLLQNLEINNLDNVRAFSIAVSDHQGTIRLSVPKEVRAKYSYGDSYLSIDPSKNDDPSAQIECRRLDDVLTDGGINHVDLIKIDVEGAEHLCLKGAEKLRSGARIPTILMECDETLSRRFGYSVFDTLLLHNHGYTCEQIGLHQWLARPITS